MKIFLLAIAILVSFNSFSQNTKTYKKGEVISSHTPDWYVPSPYVYDSVTNRKAQIKSVNELNAIRKKAGKPLLKWDDRLQPAAVHHVKYMQYCKKHHLINAPDFVEKDTIKFKDYSFMDHTQKFDIPNFTEIQEPFMRVRLLDRTVFSEMTEELGSGFDVMGFNFCPYHWADLNDAKWDAIYVYIDPITSVTIVILGKYVKVPVKK